MHETMGGKEVRWRAGANASPIPGIGEVHAGSLKETSTFFVPQSQVDGILR
jgi:hypothetical protein